MARVILVVGVLLIGFIFAGGGYWAGKLDAQEASESEEKDLGTTGWFEFHPSWRTGGSVVWENRTVDLPNNVSWASDETHYFYARPTAHDELTPTGCHDRLDDEAKAAGPLVLVTPEGCNWIRHPSLACVVEDVCNEVLGITGPAGPAP